MENQNVQEQKEVQKKKKLSVENIVGIVLIAVFLPVIIFNMVIVIKGWVHPEKVPTFLGVAPLVVGSDSMSKIEGAEHGGAFNKGDIIIIRRFYADKLKADDIITYIHDGDIITHRITEVIDIEKDEYLPAKENYEAAKAAYEEAKANYDDALANHDPLKNDLEVIMNDAKDEMEKKENTFKYYEEMLSKAKYAFNTKGDFQSPAVIRIYDYELQGKYMFRVPLLGKLIEFFQKPLGIIVLIMVPVGGYFAFELIKKAKSNKKSDEKIAELEAKLAAQEQAKQEQPKEEAQEQPEESKEDSDN